MVYAALQVMTVVMRGLRCVTRLPVKVVLILKVTVSGLIVSTKLKTWHTWLAQLFSLSLAVTPSLFNTTF